MRNLTFSRSSLVFLLFLVAEVVADDDDTDFLMNVFSDLGPVLALFGEQFARQFLSETFTWYDHLIFACVPLGIMTAIAGAIRVEGRSVLKAFIGRARENKAAAEIEYMSSTSAEVGELFNGRGIVRTMGQSNIAQFIVFPEVFNSSDVDLRGHIGIHTLKSATEEGREVLRKEDYRDELDGRFVQWFEQFKPRSERKNELEEGVKDKSNSPRYWESLQYPNLQLNIAAKTISAKQRSLELHLAAVVAVILQASLLVIAVVIPYRISGFEQQPWGLPCYMIGSVLLFVGMLACSVAIERSTKEYKWFSNNQNTKNNSISLYWVQGKQRVSDQEFGSYVIYAQDKEFLSTSSRKEDVGHKTVMKRTGDKLPWNSDIRAITALVAGGAGFTIQFIGLRGLPWPIAVAQLVALIVMAMIRALVRRRLGENTQYRVAPSDYELDFLAAQLVDTGCYLEKDSKSLPEVVSWRVDTAKHEKGIIYPFDFSGGLEPHTCSVQMDYSAPSHIRETQHWETPSREDLNRKAQKLMSVRKRLGDLCEWETRAFKPALSLVRSIERFLDEFMPNPSSHDPITWKIPLTSSRNESGTVELLIVKETKGWKINAGDVEAIVSFWLADFETSNTTKIRQEKDTEWQRSKAGIALGVEYCRILGRKYDNGVLQRDISWWVGNPAISEIETENQAPELDSGSQSGGSRTTGFQRQGSTATYRFSSQSSSQERIASTDAPYIYDSSKHNVKMVIGYAGPDNAEVSRTVYVQHSTAATATIMTQHLFTNFMWSIIDRLPKDILGQGSFDVHESVTVQESRRFNKLSSKLGMDRNLSHKNLTKFVLQAEKDGLGTFQDIFLCLIPVFSIKDRLPNDATLQFDLPKFTKRQGWPKLAYDYLALLKSVSNGPSHGFEDSLSLKAVVYALDYVYLMALDEKYSRLGKRTNGSTESKKTESNETKDSEIDSDVSDTDSDPSRQQSAKGLHDLLVNISEMFPYTFKRLWLFYELQGRADFLLDLKKSCEERISDEMWSLEPQTPEKEAFMKHVGFTKLHQEISKSQTLNLERLQGTELWTRDIFGWTALHYAAACRDLKITGCDSAFKAAHSYQTYPEGFWLDNFGRSPIHMASWSGNSEFLGILLKNMSDDDVRSTLQSRGLDGMTPIHLAISGGHGDCLDAFKKLPCFFELNFEDDAWERSPVHLSIAEGQHVCAYSLLENEELKFNPSARDSFGKLCLFYLDIKSGTDKWIGSLLFSKHSNKFRDKDNEGRTVWHHAVRFVGRYHYFRYLFVDLEAKHTSTINSVDIAQETPLHLAVQNNNLPLVEELLRLGAIPSTNQGKHRSPLMLACSLGQYEMVSHMLDNQNYVARDQDSEGRFVLHYVAGAKDCDDDVRRIIIDKLIGYNKDVDVKDKEGSTPLHIATLKACESAVFILMESGADPCVKDNIGRNALQYALVFWPDDQRHVEAMQNIVREFFTKAPRCADELYKGTHTALTYACWQGKPLDFISQLVDLSKEKDSKINLNQPDVDYGLSPLAFACREGREDVVKILLKSITVDLNQRQLETGILSEGYTPIYFALENNHQKIVEMLVSDPKRRADINVSVDGYLHALEFACDKSNEDCIRSLILHPEAKNPKFLICVRAHTIRYLSCLESIAWFIHGWEDAILDPENDVPFPLHELAEVGQLKRFQSLLHNNQLHHKLDKDGWTPADVAERFGHNEVAAILRQNEPIRDFSEHPYAEPSAFVSLFGSSELTSSKCPSQHQCSDLILDINLANGNLDVQLCYLRTKEAIPPDLKYFYFEVKILRALQKKECAVGFCQRTVPKNSLPGWDDSSFAYCGDNGGFYVNDNCDIPNTDETFDKGDVVGLGINFDTGHGYRTKNGVLLGSSSLFNDNSFSIGRYYPCIGAMTNRKKDDFQVEVTLRSSPEHPFHYKGPYDGLLLRLDWDEDGQANTAPEGEAEEG